MIESMPTTVTFITPGYITYQPGSHLKLNPSFILYWFCFFFNDVAIGVNQQFYFTILFL